MTSVDVTSCRRAGCAGCEEAADSMDAAAAAFDATAVDAERLAAGMAAAERPEER